MNDLISRKTAIERAESCTFTDKSEKRKFMDWLKYCLGQPAVESPTWIPCSERLPENTGNYMTCDEEGNIHIFWYDDCQKYPFNISEYHTRYYPIIAWMPLPQPYKGE